MADGSSYVEFLRSKMKVAPATGIDVDEAEINPDLKPFNRAIVKWALAGGRRAIFAAFGLHKTAMQIELMRLIGKHVGGRRLIVLPLGVRHEFFSESQERFQGDYAVTLKFIRRNDEIDGDDPIYVANYESVRDGKIDPSQFTAASLDEAAILRGYGTKTFQTFMPLFEGVRFKFVATATPSPNRTKELIHYAGFLQVMDTGQALTRFFQRNSEKANELTLYPHKEDEFWLWVNSWAAFLQKPSDIGFDDDGYDLPPMEVHWHEVQTDHGAAGYDRDGQGLLINDPGASVVHAAREKRVSMDARIDKMSELIAEAPDDHRILWHHLEDERRAIEAAVPGVRSIFGSQDLEKNEQNAVDFKEGRFRDLATKPEMSGAGCNFQKHCAWAIFVGIDAKFHDFIQAIYRIVRFGQSKSCRIDIVYSEAERGTRRILEEKWAEHDRMMERTTEIIRKYGLGRLPVESVLKRSIGVKRREEKGEFFRIAHNDCVDEAKRMADDSVGLVITSIPFSNHYEYTASYNDFGHTDDNDHFWRQMDFLTPELLRILQPGRMACVHVKDRVLFGNVTGAGLPTISPFHAEAIFHFSRHGFDYCGMITVDTDVVTENNGNYRLGYTEMLKDGSKMGVGSPEYVLLFHKPQSDRTRGYADEPIRKDRDAYSLARWQLDAHAHWRSGGDRFLTREEWATLPPVAVPKAFRSYSAATVYDHEVVVAIGDALAAKDRLPKKYMALAPVARQPWIWSDVVRMLTLNGSQSNRNVEKHICLARGSLVLTRGGYKPIQDMQVGDLVLTHKGRWRPVEVVHNTGVRPVVTVKAQGVPGLTLTPEHKLWTRRARDLPWSRSHSRREATNTPPGWVRADETLGSYINLKLPEVEDSSGDALLWWTVGRWLADGCFDARGNALISCGQHELADLHVRLGDRAGGIRHIGTAPQIFVKDRSGFLRAILKGCGNGAANKHLPALAFTLPVDRAKALLDGYLSGDGHHRADRNRWTASSVSKELLLGMAMLAQRAYGAVASIYPGRPAGTAVIEGRTVTTQQDWVLCFDVPDASRRKGMPFLLYDGAWKKVRTVEEVGEAETWCLRVAEDESFTAEGCIVKNCPLQFDIVDRLIDRYSNIGDTIFDPFGGLMTVPYRAIMKGRIGRASELNPTSFEDGLYYCRQAEAKRDTPSLFDLIDERMTDTPPPAPDSIDLIDEEAAE